MQKKQSMIRKAKIIGMLLIYLHTTSIITMASAGDGMLTGSETMAKTRLRAVRRLPGSGHGSWEDTCGPRIRTPSGPATSRASRGCEIAAHQQRPNAQFHFNRPVIAREKSVAENFQEPECLFLRHVTMIYIKYMSQETRRKTDIRIAAAMMFIAFMLFRSLSQLQRL